ncbi:MAG: tRNA 2-thiouridine(34) synthase MnmA [Patescibacteria group bacterium]
MKKINKKVVVAMSGGVDSSVAAALLKKEGYDVIGVFMQFWFPSGEKYGENRCCSLKSWHEAQAVAKVLAIPIHKVNFGRQFKKFIVDEFLAEYAGGRTPNPCVNCNKFIKFDLLLKYARTVFGADYLATGHYASISSSRRKPGSRVSKNKSLINSKMVFSLRRAKDKTKDQSYFLYNLTQSQLKYLLFPLGDYTKDEVRKLAKKFKLPVYDKKDSQEVCFVSTTVNDFLKKYLKLKAGDIITIFSSPCLKGRCPKGGGVLKQNYFKTSPFPLLKTRRGGYRVIGRHQGLPLYTLGQRSGIGLSGGPWYVASFNHKKNQLIVTKNQKKSNIFQKELKLTKANWIFDEPRFPLSCEAQIRYYAKPAKCVVNKQNGLRVKFVAPQRAIMPGQSVVFYKNNELLGGGIIM